MTFGKMVLFLILVSSANYVNSFAGECTESFSWFPNQEESLIGYRIYYGTSDMGPYPMVHDTTDLTEVDGRIHTSVSGLECGTKYYFVCVAYNSLVESDNSLQVSTVAGRSNFHWELFIPAIINQRR